MMPFIANTVDNHSTTDYKIDNMPIENYTIFS